MSAAQARLSAWQILLLVFTLSLCLTPFDLPGVVIPDLGARAAWWAALPALAAGLWGTAAAAALTRRFHGRPVDETVRAVLGPRLGYAYLGALVLLFLGSVPACLLVFAPAGHNELLPHVPAAFVAVMVAAVGTYAAQAGHEAVARCAEVLAPFLLGGLLIIYVPLLFIGHLRLLLPLRVPPAAALVTGPVAGAAGTVRGFLVLLVLGPLAAEPPGARRAGVAAVLAWLLILAALVLPVAIFDVPLTGALSVPFLAAVGTLGWLWLPLRSFMDLTLLVWYAVTFLVFSTYLAMAAWLIRRMFPRLPRRLPALALGAGAAVVASLPFSQQTFAGMFIGWNIGVLILGILVPTALWLGRGRAARGGGAPERTPARAGDPAA